jgi:hypothetical protein
MTNFPNTITEKNQAGARQPAEHDWDGCSRSRSVGLGWSGKRIGLALPELTAREVTS